MTEKSIPMGIGPIGSPNATFVRKFRWTLEAQDINDETTLPPHFMYKVRFDFQRQLIYLESYEVYTEDKDIEILAWLESDLKNQVMIFATYDGCGNILYHYNFYGLHVIENGVETFDYELSDPSIRKATIKFDSYSRQFKGDLVKPENFYLHKLSINESPEMDVVIRDRPSLSIEETKINHLNARTWIPGKAEWNPLHLEIRKNEEKYTIPSLIDGGLFKIQLHTYTADGSHKLETWKIDRAHVTSLVDSGRGYHVSFRYSEVRYEPTEVENAERKESKD